MRCCGFIIQYVDCFLKCPAAFRVVDTARCIVLGISELLRGVFFLLLVLFEQTVIGFGADAALAAYSEWLAVLCQFCMFVVKLLAFIFFFVWVRWTLPRFRWDQVMKLGWLYFLEITVANIFLAAAIMYFIK